MTGFLRLRSQLQGQRANPQKSSSTQHHVQISDHMKIKDASSPIDLSTGPNKTAIVKVTVPK